MSSPVDYTPVLLAQLTDLQLRVTKQESTIAALKAEVERLTGSKLAVSDTMRTSVPLRNHSDTRPKQGLLPRPGRFTGNGAVVPHKTGRSNTETTTTPRSRPKVASESDKTHTSMTLSDVLKENEKVTLLVHTGKDDDGNFIDATALSTFNGSELVVTECESVKEIVGMKSAKPGEILYKFIDELKSSGKIKKTFTIAPWKLCFVERDGVRQSLEELRNTVG
jgi:hypothetical protein